MGGSIDLGSLSQQDVEAAVENVMNEYQGNPDTPDSTTYPLIQIVSGVGADTFGAWTTIIADTGAQAVTLTHVLLKAVVATLEQFEIEIAIGAAASETKITEISGETQLLQFVLIPIFKRIATLNERVSMRVRDKNVLAVNYQLGLKWN